MMHVILLILKIIGIAFLAILGLLLLILAIVLFVPVLYRIKLIRVEEEFRVKAQISFLFPLFYATIQYMKKTVSRIRVLGFVVSDSERQKKEKKATKKKKKEKKNPKQELLKETVLEEEELIPEEEILFHEKEESTSSMEHKSGERKEKVGFFEKIKRKFRHIKESIVKLVAKIKKLLHQKDALREILDDSENKATLKFLWDELKHLLKHILPRKTKGYVAFGTGDPATTGQLLGIVSIVFARTGQLCEIRPNFTEKQIECDVEFKGRLQIFTLLLIAGKVYFHQELRALAGKFKGIKEIE